ncbi:hypothetical protein BH10ACI1_BH10ACI1_14330 [soil metagenome]
MKRSSKKKTTKEEVVETSSEEIAESPAESVAETVSDDVTTTDETTATESETPVLAETVEFSTADVVSSEDETPATEAETAEEVEAKTDEEDADELPKTVEISAVKTVAASAGASSGISAATKGLVVLLVIFALGAGLLYWKVKHGAGHAMMELNGLNKAEMELLLKDANPMMLKRLADDPELKKQQLDNLKQLFALANAAKKEGLTKDEKIRGELDNINIELTAVNYDREINKDKGSMPPFGFIGEDRVKEFWGEGQSEPSGFQGFLAKFGIGEVAKYARRQKEFDTFLNTKIELAKASGQIKEDLVPSEEDIKQAKDYFAKTRIYYEEAKEKMPTMSEDFRKKTEISIKLQQASYLSRLYAQKVLAEKVKVTDEDIQKYLSEHPELDSAAKKTKAEEILARAKNGEDFAKLADEFSEDPGNTDPATQKKKGGLYENITAGAFMPEFEQAALALEPGQIAPNLVETTYGYHIIKLEKKGETKGADGQMKPSYNVRHILISTGVQDPDNPTGGAVPVKEYVSQKLEADKQEIILKQIMDENPVVIADDFEIPQVSDEQMQQQMQQMMQQQQMQQQQNPQMQQQTNTSSNTTSNTTTTKTPVKKTQTNKK